MKTTTPITSQQAPELHTPVANGSVTLVGAGPGDPALLTLKAVRAIASATVILVDDLVHDEVLCHASPQARIVYVGKRGGCKSTPQAFIEQMMVAEYKKGEVVVRLKGGDPMIFGRAGEELATLANAGVPCTVVNGITAGLAAATSLGMPLTHRDYAHGVVFVTGHVAPGGAATDWVSLGQLAGNTKLTLVIYMGVSSAVEIERGLLVHMAAQTPVVLVQNASSLAQRQASTTLSGMGACLVAEKLTSPLVMVIGVLAKIAAIDHSALGKNALINAKHEQNCYNARLVA